MFAYGMQENPNYKLIVTSNSRWGTVSGYIPEQFQLSVSSRFSQPFGQALQESMLSQATTTIAGQSPVSQSMTGQIWQGSEPMELSMEMDLIAERDPIVEVQNRMKTLMKMAMPSRGVGGFFLKTPGPAYGAVTGREILNNLQSWTGMGSQVGQAEGVISISVGNFLYFDNVIINNVQCQVQSMMHRTGVPLHATVTIQFSTFFVMLAEDLDSIFRNQGVGFTSSVPGMVGTPANNEPGSPSPVNGTLNGLIQGANNKANTVREQGAGFFQNILNSFSSNTQGILF